MDQMILARHQGMWYEGKVVDVEPAAGATGEARYKIHFQGWNSRWDYWEKQSSGDLMADTEENRAKNMGKGKGKTNANAGKDGAKDAGKDAGKKRPSKDDGKKGGNKKAKTGSKKGGDATDTPTPDAPTPDAPPELARLRFNLSTSLKRELIAGWEKITREDKLVHLPRSVTVSTILERFESDSRAKARSPEQAEMAGEITSGLRAYFDRSLRAVLLYTQEHAQADGLLTGGEGTVRRVRRRTFTSPLRQTSRARPPRGHGPGRHPLAPHAPPGLSQVAAAERGELVRVRVRVGQGREDGAGARADQGVRSSPGKGKEGRVARDDETSAEPEPVAA